jgi:hypothetical protein
MSFALHLIARRPLRRRHRPAVEAGQSFGCADPAEALALVEAGAATLADPLAAAPLFAERRRQAARRRVA